MRKNDLIKKLQEIKGNPEICLWNGIVGDWMAIGSLQESYLCKITEKYWVKSVENEEKIRHKNWDYLLPDAQISDLKKRYKKMQWECNEFVTSEDVDQGRYKTKQVVYIGAKPRGESYYDRLGEISY